MLDYLGRATVIGDLTKSDTVSAQAVAWLLRTPWWMPGALAALVTAFWLRTMLQDFRSPLVSPPVALEKAQLGSGGTGGSGTILGSHGTIVGGRGGDGGTSGIGGAGGDGTVTGEYAHIQGGDGGSAGSSDGRGGRATAPTPRLAALPKQAWGVGRGGMGGNAPEYDRRIALLIHIRDEYVNALPDTRPYVSAGIDQIEPDWINARLSALGETWRVKLGPRGYVLPPLQVGQS